ncbi:MAG TPA: RNA 3'-terminal phosphate cyclase [Vicinamibacteria bacterium]|nr:RNA 3'-terminal phosphate cyclase [Vicinamibacteria bacterium]
MSAALVSIDGAMGEGGGQILRTALALSAASGRGFEITRIRAGRLQPGLRPQHVASVRAAAMVCGARVGGVFEGSPDLRFEPGPVESGDFAFEIATAGALSLVMQTVLPPLARAAGSSTVRVTGGTHVPASPPFHYLAQHWKAAVEPLGLRARFTLERAGFYPRGGGEARAAVEPWRPRAEPLVLEDRGALVELRGTSGAGRVKGDVAARQRQAAEALLWESRRLKSEWTELDMPAASPGSFVMLEMVFERSRAAFSLLGQRGVRAEVLGERLARTVLRFLEGEAAVDPHLADQLALPLALAGCGGRVATSEVTAHLETVAAVLRLFGIGASVSGRMGGPGLLLVPPAAR